MKEIINRIDYQINNYLDISQQPVNLDELQLEQTASQRRASPMLLKVPKDNDFAYQRCSQNKRSHQLKQNQSGRSKENIKYQNSPSILKNRDLNQHYQEQQSFDNSNNKKYVSNRCNSRSPKSKDIFNHSSNPLFSVVISSNSKPNNQYNQFSKLGLTLEHICTRERHQRSPILFLCTKQECNCRLKIGCAYCMLDDHADHAEFKIQIEDFLQIIQYKYDNYYQSIRNFQQTLLQYEEPQILQTISFQINQVKQSLCQKLDQINSKIQEQYKQFFVQDNIKTAHLVQDQKFFSSQIEKVMQANILNMNEEQRDVFMRLYNDAEIVKIEKRIEEIVNINENISEQLEASFQNFQKNLKDKLSTFLQKLDNLQLYLNINSSENTIHYLSEQKKSLQNKIQKAKKMQDQIKQINREIQILKIEKISNPFPYKLYGGLCDHVNIQCNTIQIYECCNQAFPCPDCHKNTCKDHKIFFTSPSRRYCIDCLAIFQVNHPTNTLINCSSCLSDYEQISSD
ncbi:D-hydantoinase family protein (macronuclear) [Tetrahymena thermophila SB210]|uniref:D-hydantoinase family protein n=1 Tax=Tetrahymena thermophila (strain SB210) TaxID=312017 RepID=W7XDP2_TETTS|nr:D-hydantoinase family protein [Tetrahymena thermophila SB210]EWS74778.1 D-hydantoinase family protein [Tetrahymena thermophila SB210]|eukprot:XP_012652671.1 D-hydantoinase family protein [Tetrahymena thermophila SB210]